MAVVKWMNRENIALPSRPHCGPNRGRLHWALPAFAQVGKILRNPRYAGAFAYGRTRGERQPDGTVRQRRVPREEWPVLIPNAHVGFIDWDEYLRNQATLASNASAFFPAPSRVAAPRKGAALLQSRVICGRCGRRMGPRYAGARARRNGRTGHSYVCKERMVRHGGEACQTIAGAPVDAAVSRFVIDALNRENIDLALVVRQEVRAEFAEADRQRAHRIEAIRYEADLARRRFFAVDPANRLVATALEADWNERLRELEHACRERETRAAALDAELSDVQAERIRALTCDFERVWTASERPTPIANGCSGFSSKTPPPLATATRRRSNSACVAERRWPWTPCTCRGPWRRSAECLRNRSPLSIGFSTLTPTQPPPGSSTGPATETGRASPTRPNACFTRAAGTGCPASWSGMDSGCATKGSRRPLDWRRASASPPEPCVQSPEIPMTIGSTGPSSRQTADITVCTGPATNATAHQSTPESITRDPRKLPSPHTRNRVHHEMKQETLRSARRLMNPVPAVEEHSGMRWTAITSWGTPGR